MNAKYKKIRLNIKKIGPYLNNENKITFN